MKKVFYSLFGIVFIFLAGCEKNDVEKTTTSFNSMELANAELKVSMKDGIATFANLADFEKTLKYLDNNNDFFLESLDNNFSSFYKKRNELEKKYQKPSESEFNFFFKETLIDGQKMIVSKIGDDLFEKVVNSKGLFIIDNELYKIEDDILSKRNLTNATFSKVADIKIERHEISLGENNKARSINGGGPICGSSSKRVRGDLVDFNIGFYQRLSLQICTERKNTSFWSWIDSWVRENVTSLSYNVTVQFTSGGITFPVTTLSSSCNNCSSLNRTFDWSIGNVGSNYYFNQKSGSFTVNAVPCGSVSYSF
jgi:hypothetical protein